MLHSRPLDWEVVESHAVAPVQVLFKDDGVRIHQIAPNAISGSYTFDMHSPGRKSPPASPPPKSAAAQAGRPPRASDPGTSTTATATESAGTTSYSPKKLHRKSRSAAASLSSARGVSTPFAFGILKRSTLPATSTFNEEPVDAPEPRSERRRSLGAAFSFLQPRHGRDRLISPPSPSSMKSGVSTSGSEDGSVAEPGPGPGSGSGSGSESTVVPAAPQEKPSQAKAAPTRHSAGASFPIVRPSHPTAPVASVPPPPPTPAQPSYDKAQTKKVLKHARAELMKEIGKAGYNVLVVEGWQLTVLRQSERYRIKVVYHARPAIAQTDLMEGEGMRIPRSPPYLSVLDD